MPITVTHQFVSTKPEQSDPTIIGPNEWNATHVVTGGASTAYNAPDYNFCQTPGGTLTANITNTITLTPVPLGVNGTNAQHWLYLSGGTGTSEAVLITGGTAVSGAASGTVTFVPTSNHTGAWTICTATAGIQEAIYYAADYTFVHLPAIPSPYYQVYAQIYLPNTKHLTIEGDGVTSVVVFNQTNNNGFYLDGNSSSLLSFGKMRLSGLGMTNNSYYMLYINNWSPGAIIHDLNMYGAANHVALNGQITFENIYIEEFQNVAITGLGARFGGVWVNVTCVNYGVANASAGVYINSATNTVIDGWTCVGCLFGGDSGNNTKLNYGVWINPGTGYMSNVEFTDCYIESCANESFLVRMDATAKGGTVYKFTSTRFANNSASTTAIGLLMESNATTSLLSEVIINGCYFGGATNPIVLSGITNCTISNCVIAGQGVVVAGGSQIGITIASNITVPTPYCKNITIVNNVIGYGLLGTTTPPGSAAEDGPLDIAIRVDSALHTNIVIANNVLYGMSGTPLQIAPASTLVIRNNQGLDDSILSVASAAAFTFPVNPSFNITGTTSITSVAGLWTGRTGYFRTSNAITFTAGSSIGATGTTTALKLYTYLFDGVQIWIQGPGF